MNRSELIYVRWVDSADSAGWQFPKNEDYYALMVETIGWLVRESEESITLTGTAIFGENEQVCSPITIPRVAIDRMELVEAPA